MGSGKMAEGVKVKRFTSFVVGRGCSRQIMMSADGNGKLEETLTDSDITRNGVRTPLQSHAHILPSRVFK
jgi:hypothetical protein